MMLRKKEFYFLRHGETDYNTSMGMLKGPHSDDAPLNEAGRKQAKSIEPLIAQLPIQRVCTSPFKRAQETKEITTTKLNVHFHEISDLSECSGAVWKQMYKLGVDVYRGFFEEKEVIQFIERIKNGMNHVLSLPGTSLIVSHGGVHWAICYLLQLEEHPWAIDNCIPVHFSLENDSEWKAKKLI